MRLFLSFPTARILLLVVVVVVPVITVGALVVPSSCRNIPGSYHCSYNRNWRQQRARPCCSMGTAANGDETTAAQVLEQEIEAALQQRQAIQAQLQAKVQVFQKEYKDQQGKFQKQLNTELQDQAKAFQATLRDYKVKREKEINAELQNQVNAFQKDLVDSQLKALNELDTELVKKVKRLKRVQAGGGAATVAAVFEEFPLAASVALPVTALVVGRTVLARREKMLSEQRRLQEEEEERLRAEAAAAAAVQQNATRKRRLKKEVVALLVTGALGIGGFGLTTLIMDNYKGVDASPPTSGGEPVTLLPQQSKQEPPPPSPGGLLVTGPTDTPPRNPSQESSSSLSLVARNMMEEDPATVVDTQEPQQGAAEGQSALTPSISVTRNENKMESVLEHLEWPVLGAGGAVIAATLVAFFSKLPRPAAAERGNKKAPPDFEAVMATLREKRAKEKEEKAKTLVVEKEEQSFSPPTSPTPIAQEEENAQSLDTSIPQVPEAVQTPVAEASDFSVAISEPTELVSESKFPDKGTDEPLVINEQGVSAEEVGEKTAEPLDASQTAESPDEETNEPEPVAEPPNEDILDTPKSTEANALANPAKEGILDTPKTVKPMIVSDETVVEPESTEATAVTEAPDEDILDTPKPVETQTVSDETLVEPESTEVKVVTTPQLESSPENNVPVTGELGDASESAAEHLTGPIAGEIKVRPEESLIEDAVAESTATGRSSAAEESAPDDFDELKPFTRVKKRSSAGQGFGKPQNTKKTNL